MRLHRWLQNNWRGLGESVSGVIELISRYLLGEAEEILEYLQARRPIFKRRCEPRTLLLHIYSPIARPRNPCPVHCCCSWAWRHVLGTVVERILADAVRSRRTRTNPLHCLHKYCRFSREKKKKKLRYHIVSKSVNYEPSNSMRTDGGTCALTWRS